jgi:DNA-binding response OmpR family regulator
VDDDQKIRRLLGRYLDAQGFPVTLAAERREFEKTFPDAQIDLVVLDVMLPDGSGLEICCNLRGQRQYVPIILLTALKEEIDRIIGLEIGADDYLAKPFNPRELVARIRAVLRRGWEAPEPATDRLTCLNRCSNRSSASIPADASRSPAPAWASPSRGRSCCATAATSPSATATAAA